MAYETKQISKEELEQHHKQQLEQMKLLLQEAEKQRELKEKNKNKQPQTARPKTVKTQITVPRIIPRIIVQAQPKKPTTNQIIASFYNAVQNNINNSRTSQQPEEQSPREPDIRKEAAIVSQAAYNQSIIANLNNR